MTGIKTGNVHLVGAGPGDPELITVRGMRLIQRADVVIYDRLISPEILTWCRDDAELIDVGKYPDHHRISQNEINELIVARASDGLKIVRLKGGDPFVFGRGTEELAACRSAEIPCTIVPGVSSAIAAPSAAGIPVTSRGVARSFAVITGQTDPNLPEHNPDFESLARIDTVIFLMGRRNLKNLMRSLIAAGRDPSTPAASIERATLPGQKIVTADLYSIHTAVERAGLTSPMVTIVGDVVQLADTSLVTQLPSEVRNRLAAYDLRLPAQVRVGAASSH